MALTTTREGPGGQEQLSAITRVADAAEGLVPFLTHREGCRPEQTGECVCGAVLALIRYRSAVIYAHKQRHG
jgi:hypothetical protein